MNDWPGREPTILSTHTWAYRWQWLSFLLFCGGFAAAILLVVALGLGPSTKEDRAVACGVAALLLGTGILCSVMLPRGIWVISEEGLVHHSPRGPTRGLAWLDIERVQRYAHGLIVQGADVRIVLPLHLFPTSEAKPARSRVEEALKSDFDLTPIRLASERSALEGRSAFLQVGRLAAIAVGLFVPWFGGFVALLLLVDARSDPRQSSFAMVFLTAPVIGAIVYYLIRTVRGQRRANPNHPWRVRGWKVPEWARKGNPPPGGLGPD